MCFHWECAGDQRITEIMGEYMTAFQLFVSSRFLCMYLYDQKIISIITYDEKGDMKSLENSWPEYLLKRMCCTSMQKLKELCQRAWTW